MLLVWLVISQSFAAYLAGIAPTAALWLHPRQPSALINLAEQALFAPTAAPADKVPPRLGDGRTVQPGDQSSAGKTPPSHDLFQDINHIFSAFETIGRNQSVNRPIAPANSPTIQRWVKSALSSDPLNAHALRILGYLAEADGNDALALKFMWAAVHLSLHERDATFWLMRKSTEIGDGRSAIYYADVLLRTAPELNPAVVPYLAQIAEQKGTIENLTAVLADDPPWREQFFATLPNYLTDARTALQLLLLLRASRAPPSAAEIDDYIGFLVSRKFYDLAYYTWLQFLSAKELRNAGLLFNGDFDVKPSGSPFNWQIASGSGVTVDIVPRADKIGANALLVDFQFGRVDYRSVRELVMLAPGTYRFEGKYKGQLIGPRGLKWRAACADGAGTLLGESPMIVGIAKSWKSVAFSFTVPAADCRAQYVRLDLDARMASEQLVSGSMLFDELQIARVTNRS